MYSGPILDNHFHLQPQGRFLEAARQFLTAGGTHVTLIPVPGQGEKRTVGQWREFFEAHLEMATHVARETGLTVLPVAGPYPVEFHRMALAHGIAQAADALRAGYDAAHDLAIERRIVAIGEVGRLHFEAPPEFNHALSDLLVYGMSRSREAGVPVILHTEHATPAIMGQLAALADQAGIARDRVVKHYAGPLVTDDETAGLVPSIIASRSNVGAAIAKGDRFMMETDYIDDPKRPDVVLPPHQVPKRTKALAAQGVAIESLHKIHNELPSRLYGVDMGDPSRKH